MSAKKPTQHFLHYEIFFKKKYIWQLNLTSSFSKKVGFHISTLCNLYETEPAYQFTNYLSEYIHFWLCNIKWIALWIAWAWQSLWSFMANWILWLIVDFVVLWFAYSSNSKVTKMKLMFKVIELWCKVWYLYAWEHLIKPLILQEICFPILLCQKFANFLIYRIYLITYVFYLYFSGKNTKEWLMEIADMIIDNLTPSWQKLLATFMNYFTRNQAFSNSYF